MSALRRVLKGLVPPLLVELARGRIGSGSGVPEATWDGVYARLADVPTGESASRVAAKNGGNGPGAAKVIRAAYEGPSQVDKFVGWTQRAMDLMRAGKTPSSPWHDPLALLAAVVGGRNPRVRVLDFGGGAGLGFVYVLSTLRSSTAIEYHVVELERMASAGRELFAGDPRIQFHTLIPPFSEPVDIVYMSSVLEYMDDYPALLRKLAEVGAGHLLLTQSAVGRIPTYATRQVNLPGHSLPYWFINIDEVVGTLSASGYSLVFAAEAGPVYDQSNFPETHRLGRMRNLLFVRNTMAS